MKQLKQLVKDFGEKCERSGELNMQPHDGEQPCFDYYGNYVGEYDQDLSKPFVAKKIEERLRELF
jgi:hypothetical protein